ncbi:MAG: hypothetical protein WCA10_10660 [Terracidiphilus sp.]
MYAGLYIGALLSIAPLALTVTAWRAARNARPPLVRTATTFAFLTAATNIPVTYMTVAADTTWAAWLAAFPSTRPSA